MNFKFVRSKTVVELFSIEADNQKQAAGKLRRLARKNLVKPADTWTVKRGKFRPKTDD